MEASALLDAQVQTKRIYNLMTEALDFSRQMAEAADRDDQVSFQMLLSMRAEPVRRLQEARKALEEQRDALPAADGQRLRDLLNGGAAQTAQEQGLCEQVAANKRLFEQLLALDKALNLKMTRDKSIYN